MARGNLKELGWIFVKSFILTSLLLGVGFFITDYISTKKAINHQINTLYENDTKIVDRQEYRISELEKYAGINFGFLESTYNCTVSIEDNTGFIKGSGVIIGSILENDLYRIYVLTAAHVYNSLDNKEQAVVRTYFFGLSWIDYEGIICEVNDKDADIALLSFESAINHRYLKISTRFTLPNSPICIISSPAGSASPFVTYGRFINEITPSWLPDNTFYQTSANVWFRSSGGAVVNLQTGELIGIAIRLRIDGGYPIPFINYAVRDADIIQLLKNNNFEFLLN